MNRTTKTAPAATSAPMADPVGFIRFHGMTLLVVQAEGVQYVAAKPISDLIGLKWRATRETLQAGDNVVLYGARRLLTPQFGEGLGPNVGPQTPSGVALKGGAKTEMASPNADFDVVQKGDLHLRLDRAHMFLARVNTNLLRARGNQGSAEYLLALQIEWAEALHAYESNGIAVKKAGAQTHRDLIALMKARELARPTEQAAFDKMVAGALADLGYQVKEGQQPLPLGTAA